MNYGDYIGKMVEKMRLSKGVGTCAGVVRVPDAYSGNGDISKLDRFTLTFPYGGLYLKWEVIFNINYPHQPPDFIFLSEAQSFHPDIHNLKSLTTWDPRDEDSLLRLMREMVVEFKQLQLNKIAGTRIASEVEALMQFKVNHNACVGDGKDDYQHRVEVEVNASCNETHTGQIHVMTRIPVTLINPTDPLNNTGSCEKMLVLMTYEGADLQTPNCQLFPSPKLEKALGLMGGLCCGGFPRDGGMVTHVTNVHNKLNYMMEQMRCGVEKRRSYVEAMVLQFKSHVLEFDNTTFHHVNLLFRHQNSNVLLTMEVPASFPNTQPQLTFTSMERDRVFRRLRDYPYSPRWTSDEMADRMRTYLEGNLARLENEMNMT